MKQIHPEKALNLAASLCSKKEYCSKAIREKLQNWELPEKDISQIMDFLIRHQFIDDRRYATIYAEDKFRFNHWGKQKITRMLRQKGIPGEIITEALSGIAPAAYAENCLEILRQKLRTLPPEEPYKSKGKLMRFALGKGFDYDTVIHCINRLNPAFPSDDE